MAKAEYEYVGDGVGRFHAQDIEQFIDSIRETDRFLVKREGAPRRVFIYRGQWEEKDWHLEPKLDRCARACGRIGDASFRDEQIERFRHAARGRLPTSPNGEWSELALWELGQHYGLATPLLDWSLSPFVAAFFALTKPGKERHRRVVYAYDRRTGQVETPGGRATSVSRVEVFDPPTSQNERLVAQQGVFTFTDPGQDLKEHVRLVSRHALTCG